MRQSVGVVEFEDLRLNTGGQMVITREPERDLTDIFLDLDIDGKGVLGGGDCEISLDKDNTERLLALIRQISSIRFKQNHSWQEVGEADFCGSDHSRSGEDSGAVLVESNGSEVRMTFRTRTETWMPYVATFSTESLGKLSALLSRALQQS